MYTYTSRLVLSIVELLMKTHCMCKGLATTNLVSYAKVVWPCKITIVQQTSYLQLQAYAQSNSGPDFITSPCIMEVIATTTSTYVRTIIIELSIVSYMHSLYVYKLEKVSIQLISSLHLRVEGLDVGGQRES